MAESLEYYDDNEIEPQISDWRAMLLRIEGHIAELEAQRDKPLEWPVVAAELVEAGLLLEESQER